MVIAETNIEKSGNHTSKCTLKEFMSKSLSGSNDSSISKLISLWSKLREILLKKFDDIIMAPFCAVIVTNICTPIYFIGRIFNIIFVLFILSDTLFF